MWIGFPHPETAGAASGRVAGIADHGGRDDPGARRARVSRCRFGWCVWAFLSSFGRRGSRNRPGGQLPMVPVTRDWKMN